MNEEQIAQVIDQEFFKEGGLRDRLKSDFTNIIDARIGRWFIGGGVVLIFSIASAWFTLSNQVANNTNKINNAVTTEGAALIIQRIDQLENTLQDKNDAIKSLDERLRAKGI